jgi:hypothetical protein
MQNDDCVSCREAQLKADAEQEQNRNLVNDICKGDFDIVQACMKQYKGNISDCKVEWDKFRSCLKTKKSA